MESSSNESVSVKNEQVLISEIASELDPALFKNVGQNQKKQIVAQVVSVLRLKQHRGPLPDPETLAEYDRLVPGAARLLVEQTIKQSNHRMTLETKVIGRQTWQSGVGQIFALIIGLSALGGGIWCILENHDTAGGVVITGGFVTLATTFLKSTWNQRQDLEDKKPKS